MAQTLPATPLSLKLFGNLQVQWHGRLMTNFASRKAEALLVYLVCHPYPHARESLADLLWDDRTQKQALGNLRVLLSNLRKLFPDLLHIDRQTVQLNQATAVFSDTQQLEAALALLDEQLTTTNTAVSLATALNAYHGPFLQGFYVRDARRFEEWLLLERERWQQLALRGFEQLTLIYANHDMLDEGVFTAHKLIQLDPLREHSQQLHMRLLARQGHLHAALQAYETFVNLLDTELGLPPEPETTRLAQRIRQAKTRSPYHLPQPATPLVGRQTELHDIQQRLDDPVVRVVTIVGIGGIGKTRLALATAQQRRYDYLNGICFIPLAAAENLEDLLLQLANALRLPLDGKITTIDQITNFLQQREMLLILDNVEAIIDSTATLISTLLSHAPDIQFLLTSRERLHLRHEWALPLHGLTVPKTKQEHGTATAVTLLQQRAAQFAPDLTPSPTLTTAIAQISRLVDGVPLALELAAAAFAIYTPAQVAVELQQSIDFLQSHMRDVPPRHRSMRAVFTHSWDLLTVEEQYIFSGLSLFRGDFSAKAAEAVTGCTHLLLSTLVTKSLLLRLENGRFALHTVLRQFAAEKLADNPAQQQRLITRHSHFFIDYLDQQQQAFKAQTMAAALDAVATEIDNLRVVWRRLIDEADAANLQRMVAGYTIYFYTRSLFQPGLAELTYAYDHLDQNDANTIGLCAEIRARQALFLSAIGTYEACVQAAEEALALAATDTANNHTTVLALAELCRGYALWSQGDYDVAQTHLQTAVATADLPDLSWIKAQSLSTLGNVLLDQGDIPTAHTYYEQAIAIAEPAGQQRIEASVHINIGNAHWHNGDFSAARQQFQQAATQADTLGTGQIKSLSLLNIGLVESELGNHAASIANMQAALQLSRDVSDRRGEGNILVNLIAVLMEAHHLGEAGELLHDALSTCREVGDKQGEAIALELAADWHLVVGDYAQAETLLTEVSQVCTANDDTWGLMEMQLSWAYLYTQKGLLTKAETAVRDGLAQTQTLQDPANEAKAYTLLGAILIQQEDYVQAKVAHETAVSLRRELGQTHLLIENEIGQLFCQQALGQTINSTHCAQMLEQLLASSLNGILMPGNLFYMMWQLLLAQKNPRAADVQQHGGIYLQQVAEQLAPAARHTFLTNVPAHRSLLANFNPNE